MIHSGLKYGLKNSSLKIRDINRTTLANSKKFNTIVPPGRMSISMECMKKFVVSKNF